MDWILLRFLKNESLGYYEDLACDFQDKSMRTHVDGQVENHKKGEVRVISPFAAGFKSLPAHLIDSSKFYELTC